ncbi:MAG TPA: hypothetical protein IGS17_05350 [Oscillatoriales cyanobacterium M59_W2019_021]|nr:hypothetical protein [Oscillatoriales cyanobacterium M4454_W2019_049]HIK50340.1 hypothetical protein [Oscillatoriales cyanobacterium M59_W2019_021]
MTYSSHHLRSLSKLLGEKRSSYGRKVNPQAIEIVEPISSAPPEVKKIIERVLQVEKDRLYTQNYRGINDDILKIIQEAIPE